MDAGSGYAEPRSRKIAYSSKPPLLVEAGRRSFNIEIRHYSTHELWRAVGILCSQAVFCLIEDGDLRFFSAGDDSCNVVPNFYLSAGQREAQKPIQVLLSPQRRIERTDAIEYFFPRKKCGARSKPAAARES